MIRYPIDEDVREEWERRFGKRPPSQAGGGAESYPIDEDVRAEWERRNAVTETPIDVAPPRTQPGLRKPFTPTAVPGPIGPVPVGRGRQRLAELGQLGRRFITPEPAGGGLGLGEFLDLLKGGSEISASFLTRRRPLDFDLPSELGKHLERPAYQRIPAELLGDPLNLVPGVGFTKLPRLAGKAGAAAREVVPLARPLRTAAAAAEVPETGAIQAGMGIGEEPAQGTLGLGGRIEARPPVPLIDAEQVAQRQRLAAERAAGQQGLPEAPIAALPTPTLAETPPPGGAIPPTVPPPGGAVPAPGPVGPRRALTIEPFDSPANRLLGTDTSFEEGIRKIPVLRQIYGGIDPAAIHQAEPVARLGITKQIFKETHHANAKVLAMEWMNEAKNTLGFNVAGRARLVEPAVGVPRGPLFRTIFDLVEHPERYIFTPAQQDAIQRGQDIMASVLKAEQEAGVEVGEVANYWYRNVLGSKDDSLLRQLVGKAGRGSARGHTRSRFYEFAEDTVNAGKRLELNPLTSLTRRLEAGINAIADKEVTKRIAELPGIETPLERASPEILATAKTAVQNRRIAQGAITAIQRAKRGEQLPVSTIKAIERVLPQVEGLLKPASRITLDDLIQAGGRAGATPTPRKAPVSILREPHMDALNDLLQQVRGLAGPVKQQELRVIAARTAEMARASQPRMGEALILGKIAPEELVNEINKWIEVPGFGQRPTGEGLVPEALRLWRSTMVSLDLSAGYIQGQSLFYRNNVAWWKAQAAAITSLVDQPISYVSKHYDTITEGINNGAIVPPTEMLFGERGLSALPTRIPVVGSAFRRPNRAFEWFIFVGQHELYRAARGTKAEAELVSLGSSIRKILGTESYATLGVSRRQQTLEAYLAFAPRFYRALLGTVAQGFTLGPGGATARQALGSMIAGATALTIGVNYATQRKLPNFTEVDTETWGKAKVGESYVSFYGPFHSFFRTLARAGVYTSEGDPKRAVTEIGRFFKSKASLPVRGAETAAEIAVTGSSRTFEGERIDLTPKGALNFLKEQAPIGPAQVAKGVIEKRPEETLNIVGLNVTEANREKVKEYELSGRLPPKGTNIRVLRTAYWQAGEGRLSAAGRDAWRKYEPLPASERKLYLRTLTPALRIEMRRVETYRETRRPQLARTFSELDVLLVEEAWNARPQRPYTPKTTEGKRRLNELRKKKFGASGPSIPSLMFGEGGIK